MLKLLYISQRHDSSFVCVLLNLVFILNEDSEWIDFEELFIMVSYTYTLYRQCCDWNLLSTINCLKLEDWSQYRETAHCLPSLIVDFQLPLEVLILS